MTEETPILNKSTKSDYAAVSAILAFFVLCTLAMIVGTLWILDAPDNDLNTMSGRAEAFRNAGLVALGTIGLGLAIWRSSLSFRQTYEAIQQGNRTEQQLRHTADQLEIARKSMISSQENNFASMFERASELVNGTSDAKKSAGVELLRFIANKGDTEFGEIAVELLISFLAGKQLDETSPGYIRKALETISGFPKIGPDSPFKVRDFVVTGFHWMPFFHKVAGVHYKGAPDQFGVINGDISSHAPNTFEYIEFRAGKIDMTCKVIGAVEFIDCKIVRLHDADHRFDRQPLGANAPVVAFTSCNREKAWISSDTWKLPQP